MSHLSSEAQQLDELRYGHLLHLTSLAFAGEHLADASAQSTHADVVLPATSCSHRLNQFQLANRDLLAASRLWKERHGASERARLPIKRRVNECVTTVCSGLHS
jgi:hypothetical protein